MLTTWIYLYFFWNIRNVLDSTLLLAPYIFIKSSKNCSSNTQSFMILRSCYVIKLCPGCQYHVPFTHKPQFLFVQVILWHACKVQNSAFLKVFHIIYLKLMFTTHFGCLRHTGIDLEHRQWRTEGGWGCSNTPPPRNSKPVQNRAKLNPICKNC